MFAAEEIANTGLTLALMLIVARASELIPDRTDCAEPEAAMLPRSKSSAALFKGLRNVKVALPAWRTGNPLAGVKAGLRVGPLRFNSPDELQATASSPRPALDDVVNENLTEISCRGECCRNSSCGLRASAGRNERSSLLGGDQDLSNSSLMMGRTRARTRSNSLRVLVLGTAGLCAMPISASARQNRRKSCGYTG